MSKQIIDGIPVWGTPLENAVEQMKMCSSSAEKCALMADHHLGYSQPIGGVVAYSAETISPSGVGYDIACGNKAVRLNVKGSDINNSMDTLMDDIVQNISFGIGRKNKEKVDDPLFDDFAWEIIEKWDGKLEEKAMDQLGTVGSGNHYVDIFVDENDDVWIGVHFGSRGLGHAIASHYIKEGGGRDGINEPPTLLSGDLAEEYRLCMALAGDYAYAGRDWVCDRVAKIIGGEIVDEVHNHHNFAWYETHNGQSLTVIRKGATPCFPGKRSFIGGSMGENSVIIEGVDSEESKEALYSTVHGAGRIMSRREAAGRRKWKKGKIIKLSEGKVSNEAMQEWVSNAGVCLRGGGTDESPHCYKRLSEVLDAHKNTLKILHQLKPIGVAMAGEDICDPYKD